MLTNFGLTMDKAGVGDVNNCLGLDDWPLDVEAAIGKVPDNGEVEADDICLRLYRVLGLVLAYGELIVLLLGDFPFPLFAGDEDGKLSSESSFSPPKLTFLRL